MRRLPGLILVLLLFPLLLNSQIHILKITGPIETITEEYITDYFKKLTHIEAAGQSGDSQNSFKPELIIIQLDTPGGFDTSMRSIIKSILASPVPVVTYVSPQGARAASAGFLITIAADVAVMAPGTNMGAAHPVAVSGQKVEETMNKKITNDAVSYVKSLAKSRNRNIDLAAKAVEESASYTAEKCLENNLIEIIAKDISDLIKQLDGKEIKRVDGKRITVNLKGATVTYIEMTKRQLFLKTITNPNMAYFLLIFGLIGLYLEFTHPGMIVPGVLGGISLLLAFMAFQILPLNYVGLLLILLSIGFFVAEIKIQGFGAFGIGGIASFVLGSIMLIDTPIPEMRPAMSMIITFALCFGAIFFFLTYKVIESMRRKPESGSEGMKGETGVAKKDITSTSGKAFVHGEWWEAVCVSDETIPAGAKVTVVSVENLVLKVKPLEDVTGET